MNAPAVRSVEVNGFACRVWEKGDGEPIGVLAGIGGFQRWTPFLEALSQSRRVVVPSLPGFPGGEGHEVLDTQLDWLLATHDLLTAADLTGTDLVGVSVGAALAADAAACWPALVNRLALVSPLGIFDEDEPVTDVFAQRPGALPALRCHDPANFEVATAPNKDDDPTEGQIIAVRAHEAAARLLWPVLDTRLARRLPRIGHRTLIVAGANDQVLPASYSDKFAALIPGPTEIVHVTDAGHLVDLDAPEVLAATIVERL